MLFGLKSILENTTVCDFDAQLSPYAAQEIAYECNLELLKLKEYECECESTVLEQYRNAKYANSSITMESFAPQLRVVQEGFLKNWYEKVKKFIIKIWNNIKNFFKKLFGKSASDSENFRIWLEKNKAKFANIPDDYEYKATGINYFEVIKNWDPIMDSALDATKGYINLLKGLKDSTTESPLGENETADKFVADKMGITLGDNESLTTAVTKKLHDDKDKPEEFTIYKSAISYQTILGSINELNAVNKSLTIFQKYLEENKKVVEELIRVGLQTDKDATEDEKKEAKDKTEKAVKAFQSISKVVMRLIQLFMKEANNAIKLLETVTKNAIGKATDKKDDTKKQADQNTGNK